MHRTGAYRHLRQYVVAGVEQFSSYARAGTQLGCTPALSGTAGVKGGHQEALTVLNCHAPCSHITLSPPCVALQFLRHCATTGAVLYNATQGLGHH